VDAGVFFGIFWVLLAVSYVFEAIGLSALVGAFFVGLVIPRNPVLVESSTTLYTPYIFSFIITLAPVGPLVLFCTNE
jgi:Kef-type K+ transport system membrane component KefB